MLTRWSQERSELKQIWTYRLLLVAPNWVFGNIFALKLIVLCYFLFFIGTVGIGLVVNVILIIQISEICDDGIMMSWIIVTLFFPEV